MSTPFTINFPTSLDDADSLGRTANNATTVLNGSITDTDTTITVISTSLFPASGSITINSEIIYYTGKTSTTFTGCVRGSDGTSAVAHTDGVAVDQFIISRNIQVLVDALIAIEAKLGYSSSTPSSGKFFKGTASNQSAWSDITGSDIVSGTISDSRLSSNIMYVDGSRAFTNPVSGVDPSSSAHLTTKNYVDATIQGLQPKPTARLATTAALPSNTYNNGSSGVGATLTGTATGILTIDGVTVALNDIILVKNETTSANNGLYKCTIAGAVGVAYALTRHVDMDTTGEFSGAFVPVGNEGTVNLNTLWLCNPSGTVTVGTTSIPFTELNAAADLTAGAGISISGRTISTDLSTLVNSQTIFDGSQSSRTITFNLSGTDPVLTLSSNVFNISTGTLQQGGTAVVLQSRTLTAGTGISTIGDLSTDRTISINLGASLTWTATQTFGSGFRDKAGQVFNVLAYGAVGDGSTDDSSAIASAITACKNAGGGIVLFPQTTASYAIASQITVGDGTSTTLSTYHGVQLIGVGSSRLTATVTSQAVKLLWTGSTSTSNNMIKLAGPIGGVKIENLILDCASKAGQAIVCMNAEGTIISDIEILNHTNIALDVDSFDTSTFGGDSTFNQGNNGQVKNIAIHSTNNNTTGIRLGATGNVAQWDFIGGRVRLDGTTGSNSIILSFADHNQFYGMVTKAETGLRIKSITGHTTFPINNFFWGSSINGSTGSNCIVVDNSVATWAPVSGFGQPFLGMPTADGATTPANKLIWGFNDNRQFFGGGWEFAGPAVSGGQTGLTFTPGAHTSVTSEIKDWNFAAHTMTASSNYTTQRFTIFDQPTIAGSAATKTITNAATLAIVGAPIAGTNAAITNAYSLWVQAGITRLDGGVLGTSTNDSATAGNIGELISSTTGAVNSVSLTNVTAKTITSISLTAGDWDVEALTYFVPGATTTIQELATSISTTNNTLDTSVGRFTDDYRFNNTTGGVAITHSMPRVRISLASTTTIYLIGYAQFSVSTMSSGGTISARRVR